MNICACCNGLYVDFWCWTTQIFIKTMVIIEETVNFRAKCSMTMLCKTKNKSQLQFCIFIKNQYFQSYGAERVAILVFSDPHETLTWQDPHNHRRRKSNHPTDTRHCHWLRKSGLAGQCQDGSWHIPKGLRQAVWPKNQKITMSHTIG